MTTTNRWNRIIYRLWSPVYDTLFGPLLARGRRRALELLSLQAGERVLLVGVGTGADLPLLPDGVQAVGVDLSREMLAQARAKLPWLAANFSLIQGDAQQLPLGARTYDAAILSLVLSVVPDGAACFRETLRVLRPGARLVVFDKFLPENTAPGPARRALNRITSLLGTDINRRLCDVIDTRACVIIHQEANLLRGAYQIVVMEKQEKAT